MLMWLSVFKETKIINKNHETIFKVNIVLVKSKHINNPFAVINPSMDYATTLQDLLLENL